MNRYGIAVLFALVMIVAIVHRTATLRAIAGERTARVAIVYTPGASSEREIREAYAESLRESGIAFDWLASTDLALFSGEQLVESYAAIVFPDAIDRRISEDAVAELTSFASLGGSVAVIGDAGSETHDGFYRPGSLFSESSGVDSFLYRRLRARAFGDGKVHFASLKALDRWQIPSGKTTDGDLSGYVYGPLDYPYSRAEIVSPGVRVDAATGRSPMVSIRRIGHGRVAYIGLPLGYLRTHSDAFPMTLLTSFLTRFDDLPHLVAAPDGIGQMVLDIHIDSAVEFKGIPNLERRHLLRHDVPMEFDVTAGPDRDRAGDGLGFDACGRGRTYLHDLMAYGRIGSHGGWAHNLFAENLAADRYTQAQIRDLVARNDACLESQTGVPVRSYAAPVGVHPQPKMTEVLDGLGIIGYYYTGDTGAPVERPFFAGSLVSSKSWAFPVMPLGDVASVAEMRRANISPARVETWLADTADYAAERRGIYLVYSHSYDFEFGTYAGAMSRFLDHVEAMQRAGRLHTTDMVCAAEFMDRYMATTASFEHASDGVRVHLYNPRGLNAIAFAVPAAWIRDGAPPHGLRMTGTQGGYAILSVDSDPTVLDVLLSKAEPA